MCCFYLYKTTKTTEATKNVKQSASSPNPTKYSQAVHMNEIQENEMKYKVSGSIELRLNGRGNGWTITYELFSHVFVLSQTEIFFGGVSLDFFNAWRFLRLE